MSTKVLALAIQAQRLNKELLEVIEVIEPRMKLLEELLEATSVLVNKRPDVAIEHHSMYLKVKGLVERLNHE